MTAEVTGRFPAGTSNGFVTFTPVHGGPTMGAPIATDGTFRMRLPQGTYCIAIVSATHRRAIPAAVIDRPHYQLP